MKTDSADGNKSEKYKNNHRNRNKVAQFIGKSNNYVKF